MTKAVESHSLFEIDNELDNLLEQIEEQAETDGEPSEELLSRFPGVSCRARREGRPDWPLCADDGGA